MTMKPNASAKVCFTKSDLVVGAKLDEFLITAVTSRKVTYVNLKETDREFTVDIPFFLQSVVYRRDRR